MKYAIYKGVSGKWGGIQFNVTDPRLGETSPRPRSVMVDICSPKGENKYDWDNKIQFALSVDELGQILHFFVTADAKGNLNLVHDPNMKSENAGKTFKTMNFYTREGVLDGLMITMTQKENDKVIHTHKVPVSGPEVMVLKSLFESAISMIMEWF